MKVLAIDTATALASVALTEEDKVIAECSVSNIKTHSKVLMPIISKIFDMASLKPEDIDVIGVSIGPGSFTGVRIGVATAKGMAISLKKPLIGISTLDGLAQNTPFVDSIICPILDAREHQVNNALYRFEKNALKRLTDYRAIDIDELLSELKEYRESIIFSGDGVFLYKDILIETLAEKALLAPVNAIMPRASSIAHLAAKRAKEGTSSSSLSVVPIYLKKSYAERVKENKDGM
ncbi:tRNA threonylcarbamoyladenosine biosynthesis protein TsaB [Caldanaerobius fijiensis DSM 17918]|uniref:tRNA threonylcarbamoyladenosine biosynthesis protein TsaB n=1 Tax=Caldanaerobius fijiensis DSM 17918 TaxID=1121256 RepID=A0A1M4VY74_9THEO|nr:tRNA (adenosine(37)-N6)-threonylcarbamoyltransferase complex dimerization subunit type 1 TsaB [Caldanaerobius fijiensis]SHE73865.1 tRNA threonylcarbamoyladenosine biosynthesis protein TsaB [Caldanaerobius fijiensis DSM 17918]